MSNGERSPSVGIMGAGRIAELLSRAIASRAPAVPLMLAGRNRGRCEAIRRLVPGLAIVQPEILARSVDLLFLAVPAEAYLQILGSIASALAPECILVSLTNGVALEALGAATSNPVVKVVPTMAHLVGRGTALIIRGPHADDAHLARAAQLLRLISRPAVVDDRDARVASNVAGSFVALAAAFTNAFVAANAERALLLDRSQLDAMAAEALGAVSDLVAAGHRLTEIVDATATPGGPTEAALAACAAQMNEAARQAVVATFRNQDLQRAAARRGA